MKQETEVRFLEINKSALLSRLKNLGAEDKGEEMLEEVIIYDKGLKWLQEKRFIRLRKTRDGVVLTYKQHSANPTVSAQEIEFPIPSLEAGIALFENTELEPFRHQQKLRHTLRLGNITFDIDTWPRMSPYLEIEASSEDELKKGASLLGLNWSDAVYDDAKAVLEKRYNIPMGTMRWLTFERFE